jgi:pimeloyl-ACP methyl ester carboxylesterase
MTQRAKLIPVLLLLLSFNVRSFAQDSWRDPSPHTVQLLSVDEDVKLEVLDWGGTGSPLVLLAGFGNTAHVFDDFAPKLTSTNHVYGITRRAFGVSSHPATGYSADRLGDDVLAVLDALKLQKPILVGHSFAGEELSSVGTRYPQRIAGLIYLEAAYDEAYYTPSLGDFDIDLPELKKKLEQLQAAKEPKVKRELIQELLETDLPVFETGLDELRKMSPDLPSPPRSTVEDRKSVEAWQSRQKRNDGVAMPESELRHQYEVSNTGVVGSRKPLVDDHLFVTGLQKFTDFRVPILAIFASPHDWGPFLENNPAAKAAMQPGESTMAARVAAFESGVPSAHVVRLPNANHYVFISNEIDVLREMHNFIENLR